MSGPLPQRPPAATTFKRGILLGDTAQQNDDLGCAAGVRSEVDVAWTCFVAADRMGDAVSAYRIGMFIDSGQRSAAKTYLEPALSCFQRAADRGHAAAMAKPATIDRAGIGTSKDEARAWAWYRKSAELANADATLRTAKNCEADAGLGRDDARALAWYQRLVDKTRDCLTCNLRSHRDTPR